MPKNYRLFLLPLLILLQCMLISGCHQKAPVSGYQIIYDGPTILDTSNIGVDTTLSFLYNFGHIPIEHTVHHGLTDKQLCDSLIQMIDSMLSNHINYSDDNGYIGRMSISFEPHDFNVIHQFSEGLDSATRFSVDSLREALILEHAQHYYDNIDRISPWDSERGISQMLHDRRNDSLFTTHDTLNLNFNDTIHIMPTLDSTPSLWATMSSRDFNWIIDTILPKPNVHKIILYDNAMVVYYKMPGSKKMVCDTLVGNYPSFDNVGEMVLMDRELKLNPKKNKKK